VKTLPLSDAKAQLLELIDAVMQGEEIIIAKHGKPVAKLVGFTQVETRKLGFYPLDITDDLLEPTDEDTVDSFYTS
jgi:prevent-host-death family protein